MSSQPNFLQLSVTCSLKKSSNSVIMNLYQSLENWLMSSVKKTIFSCSLMRQEWNIFSPQKWFLIIACYKLLRLFQFFPLVYGTQSNTFLISDVTFSKMLVAIQIHRRLVCIISNWWIINIEALLFFFSKVYTKTRTIFKPVNLNCTF